MDSTLRKTDGDTRFMKMKDGSTHLAPHSLRKTAAENAIDLEASAILAAEITPTNRADSATVSDTLNVAIAAVIDITGEDRVQETVADKGLLQTGNVVRLCRPRPRHVLLRTQSPRPATLGRQARRREVRIGRQPRPSHE